MSGQHWTVVDRRSGEVLAQVVTSGGHPRHHGFDWNGATMRAVRTDRQGDPARERFDGRAWVEDGDKATRCAREREAAALTGIALLERIEAIEAALGLAPAPANTRGVAVEGQGGRKPGPARRRRGGRPQ